MSVWRVIITDSESLSGVAPICPRQSESRSAHDLGFPINEPPRFDEFGVYDCCPGPHIECYTMPNAQAVADALNAAEAEVCS